MPRAVLLRRLTAGNDAFAQIVHVRTRRSAVHAGDERFVIGGSRVQYSPREAPMAARSSVVACTMSILISLALTACAHDPAPAPETAPVGSRPWRTTVIRECVHDSRFLNVVYDVERPGFLHIGTQGAA